MAAESLAVGVVGASGLVGRDILDLLDERQLVVGRLALFGSVRTAGSEVDLGDRHEKIALLGAGSFADLDVVFFTAGPTLAGEFAPQASAAGAVVIDTSSRFRLDPEVPLIVPEINTAAIGEYRERGILATPSPVATALAVVLAPLAARAGLRRVVVATYQGVSGAGRRALVGLSHETIDLLNARGPRRTRFARRIAFNCIPQVGSIGPAGGTSHELQVIGETRKVLGLPELAMAVTAVRVPIFYGHGLALNVETEEPLDAVAAADLLRAAPGVFLHETEDDPYPTPSEIAGSESAHVGRLRDDPSTANGLNLWVALDNVRKGAALNAVQVAEILVREYL
jgi:aspartate-semialdehyde dehydrogenase